MENRMHGFRARLDYALKHNYVIYKIFNVSSSMFMRIWGKFVPMDETMVLFNAQARKYNDSPRAIYDYMYNKPQFEKYKYVWALEDPDNTEIPGNPIKVKVDTLDYFKMTLKAKYWITCVNIERSLHYKRKNCVYLNTWHGTAFNTIGNMAKGRKDYDFSSVDFFCYESEFQKDICMKSFNTREEAMIPTGYPRNDTLYYVTSEEVKSLKERMGLPLDKKIILYAPTWRDSTDNGKTFAIKPPINVDYWKERLGKDYIVLFRTHTYTNKLLGVVFNDVIRDYTSYPVVNDLFKVADILISDYSSCVTDYCILERPIICFAYDYEEYKEARGLNIDFKTEMPSGIKKTEKEVIDHILSMDYDEECKKTKALKDKYTYIGGHATEICVEKMFGTK